MTDGFRLPPHLKVLGEVWSELAHWLDRAIVPALPHQSDHLDRAQADRFTELSDRETRAMIEWINRVTAWFQGPLAAALGNKDIDLLEMRRISERFSHFASDLMDRREILRGLANDPAMRAAAPYLDATYVSLLRQIQIFALKVADATGMDATGPSARSHPNATHKRDGGVELSFEFAPKIDAEMARYQAWMVKVRAGWEGNPSGFWKLWRSTPASEEIVITHSATATAISDSPAKAAELVGATVTLLFAGAFLAALVIWGGQVVFYTLALLALIWCIRHPRPVLIALLLLVGFGPD